MKKIVESYDEFLNEAKVHKIIDKLVVAIQNSDMGGDDDEVDGIILYTVLEVVGDDKKVIDALQKLLKDMTDDEDDMDESKSTVTEARGPEVNLGDTDWVKGKAIKVAKKLNKYLFEQWDKGEMTTTQVSAITDMIKEYRKAIESDKVD